MKREIELPDWRGQHNFGDGERAGHVRPLAEAYRDHYSPGEPLDVAIIDLIADLLHLNTELEDEDRAFDGEDHIDVLARARSHYEYEQREVR